MPDMDKVCTCGHVRRTHYFERHLRNGGFKWSKGECTGELPGPKSCICRHFAPAMTTSRRRSIRNKGHEWNRQAAADSDGAKLGGVGQPDIINYAKDGGELAVGEAKEGPRFSYKYAEDALAQAGRHARGRRGTPLVYFAWKSKPGPGHQAVKRAYLAWDDFCELVKMAGGKYE